MNVFYGGKFIEKSKLEEVGIYYPVKLEYYKMIENPGENQRGITKFGISIVKTAYIPDNINIDTKDIKNLSEDELKVEKILSIFKENEVTPLNAEEIIYDLEKEYFIQETI